jgi:hypothetical protein
MDKMSKSFEMMEPLILAHGLTIQPMTVQAEPPRGLLLEIGSSRLESSASVMQMVGMPL